MSEVHAEKRFRLRENAAAPSADTSERTNQHILEITSRSQASRVIQVDFAEKFMKIPAEYFRVWLAKHLTLAPARRFADTGITPAEDSSGHVERCPCSTPEDPAWLDSTGAHAAACLSAKSIRKEGHTGLRHVVRTFCEKAAMVCQNEPSARYLIPSESPDVLDRLFAKNPTRATKAHDVAVKALLASVQVAMAAGNRTKATDLLNQCHTLAMTKPAGQDGHTLVLDLECKAPNGEHVVIDFSTFESTCASYRTSQLAWQRNLQQIERAAHDGGLLPPAGSKLPSKAMTGRVVHKHDKYSPLLTLMNVVHLQRRGAKPPKMVAAVANHSGELAPDFIHLIEWMTKHYRRYVTFGSAGYNGLPPARRAAAYRTSLKNAIQVRIAMSGAALMAGAGTCIGALSAAG